MVTHFNTHIYMEELLPSDPTDVHWCGTSLGSIYVSKVYQPSFVFQLHSALKFTSRELRVLYLPHVPRKLSQPMPEQYDRNHNPVEKHQIKENRWNLEFISVWYDGGIYRLFKSSFLLWLQLTMLTLKFINSPIGGSNESIDASEAPWCITREGSDLTFLYVVA